MPVTHAIRRAFIHDMRLSSFSQSCSIITPWRASLVSSARNLSACSFRRHSVLSSNSNRPPPVCVYFSLRCFHNSKNAIPIKPIPTSIINAGQYQSCSGPQGGGRVNIHVAPIKVPPSLNKSYRQAFPQQIDVIAFRCAPLVNVLSNIKSHFSVKLTQ